MRTPPRTRRNMLTPAQLRGARAMIGWSRERLAEETGVPNRTLEKFETGNGDLRLQVASRVRRTLEKAGLIFIDPDQELGPGVRLREGRKT
ncbi:MAG: helix-turn-helix transcriptional regulator [Hyphomicrobiaceae bacterium]